MTRNSTFILLLSLFCTSCSGKLVSSTPEMVEVPATLAMYTTQPPGPTYTATTNQTPEPTPTPTQSATPAGPFHPVDLEKELPSDLLSIIHAADNGTLWLLTEQDILILREEKWEVALSDLQGELIGVDASGLIWVMSTDGRSISSWDGNEWSTYAEESGWVALHEYSFIKGSLIADHFDHIWIVTSEDLRNFDGQRWERFTPKDLGLSHPLEMEEDVLPDLHLKFLESSQQLWLGSCNWTGAGPIGGQGVLRYEGQTWREIDPMVSAGCTEVIEEDRLGRIWFGLDGDVWRYEPDTGLLDLFAAPPSPFGGSDTFGGVESIALDYDNLPWADFLLCGGGGCGFGTILFRIDQDEWIEITQEDFSIHTLVFGPYGRAWLLSPGGIFEIINNQPEIFIELPIIPNSAINNGAGQIWFLVKRGAGSELWTLAPDAVSGR